ncbi:MAG: C13 family peptidase [Pseudomonadota bacterium]
MSGGENRAERNDSLAAGPELERGLSVAEMLEQRRRLDGALGQIQPQRPGIVDAYVLTIALDSDPVFAREAREAERVLSRRYGAEGRSVALAGPDGRQDDLPRGSISALVFALARIAEQMDTNEDVLVLYSTSHGLPQGLAYHYGDTGYGILSPERFQAILEELGIERRILLISACYSGVFIPALASDSTAILTASTGNRTSFGCEAENDWTFFGDALINRALRKPQSLEEASKEASLAIAGWELRARAPASLPQTVIGNDVSDWIDTLDENIPAVAGEPVGRPAAGE